MTFNKVDIALPSEIKEYYATTPEEKQADLHADFKNAINAAKIHFEKVCISNMIPSHTYHKPQPYLCRHVSSELHSS